VLYRRLADEPNPVIDPRYVGMMNGMMQETLLSGTARKAELPGWQAAGKTGTSQDFRDAWFVGYSSALVTGVWLGNDDNSPTRKMTGGGLPVEVWTRFMRTAHQGIRPMPLPGSGGSGGGLLPAIADAFTPNPSSAPPMPPESIGGRRPPPTPVSQRPVANSGIDGWLMDRLMGR